MLTPYDVQTYLFLERFIKEWSFSPSHRELAEAFGISRQSAAQRLERLQAKGYIDIGTGRRMIRIIKDLPGIRRTLGR